MIKSRPTFGLPAMIAWTLGVAPALLFILTWNDSPTPWQGVVKAFALPVLAAELSATIVSFREGIRIRLPRAVILLLLLLATLAWVTAATAPYPVPALFRTGAWMIHLFFGLAVVNLWHHRMLDLAAHVRATQVGFLLFLPLMIVFAATTTQNAEEAISNWPAVGNIRWFSYYAAPVVGLAAAGFLQGKRFALIVATAAFTAIFWTGARGGIAATVVGFAACSVLFPAFRSQTTWLRFIGAAGAGFALSVLLTAAVPIAGQGPESMARFGGAGRVEIWIATLDSIRQRPVFGWGEGQTVIFTPRLFGWTFPQPHNIVLQVLHAWGIAGASLVLALAAWATPLFLRARSAKAAPFQCAALMLAAYSFIDGALFYSQSLALFALCVAAAMAVGLEEAAQTPGLVSCQ